jgi:hypothetical protein
MKNPPLKSTVLILFGFIALLWVLLSLIALVAGFTGHNVLFGVVPGSVTLPPLSLFGKVYLALSAILPFVVLGAIAAA